MVMSSAFGTTDLNCFPAFYPVGWPLLWKPSLGRAWCVGAVGSEGSSPGLWLGGGEVRQGPPKDWGTGKERRPQEAEREPLLAGRLAASFP